MSKETIIPIGEYILIAPNQEPENEGGPILRVNLATNSENNRGTILAVGDKVNTDEDSFKLEEGQTAIYLAGSGVKLSNSLNSQELVNVKSIIGIVKGE